MINRKDPGIRDTDTEINAGKIRKRRAEGKLSCKSGISVRSDISFRLVKESPSYFPVLQLLLASAATISVIFMLQSYFLDKGCKFPLANADAICLTIIMTALSSLMIARGKLFFKLAGGAYLLLNVLYIFSNSKEAADGFMYTANAYSIASEMPFHWFDAQLTHFNPETDLGTFLIAVAFTVTLLSSIACIFYVNFPILFLVTFPVFELGAYHGWKPAIWTVVVMVMCWVTTLSVSLINHTARRTSKSNFAVSLKKKTFYLTSSDIKTKFFSTHAVMVLGACACAFTVALTFYGIKGNYRPESFKDLRRNITRKFGEVTTNIANGNLTSPKIPGRSTMVGGTNGGQRLGANKKIEFTDKVALRILGETFQRPLYIRGYSAELYQPDDDNSGYYEWKPIYADKQQKEQFAERGFHILDYTYLQTIENQMIMNASESEMRISPVNCDPEVFYAPYCAGYSECDMLKDKEQDFDGMISPKSQKMGYEVKTFAPDQSLTWDNVLEIAHFSSFAEQFEDSNSFYADYVQTNSDFYYVPESLKPIVDDIIIRSNIDQTTDTLRIIKSKLKNYLAENGFTYSTEPGNTPVGEDFIKYFLEGKTGGKGYCQYYASAAIMFLRELGYPARYVEGYIVEPGQVPDGKTWVTVSDRCAHAWCEVFIDGFGWYPFELTPGYTGSANPNLTEKDYKPRDDDSSEADNSSSKTDSKKDSSSKGKKEGEDSSKKEADTDMSSSQAPKPVPGKVNPKDGGSDPNGGDGVSGARLTYVLMTTLFIVGFAAAIVVRRKRILTDIEQSINDPEGSKSVISCYTSLLKYISLLGIKNDPSLTDVQLSSRITTELGVMSPELNSIFVEISEPAITAYMSGEDSDQRTAERSRNLLKLAQKTIFGRLGFFGKLSARWISGLY